MRLIIVVLLLVVTSNSFCQPGIDEPIGKTYDDTLKAFNNQLLYKTAFLKVTKIVNGDTVSTSGSGFFIGENYVASCYHVYSGDGIKPIEVKVFYNLRIKNQITIYDSIYATLDYPVKEGQYDFKTHKYDTGSSITDFVVLKLLKRKNGKSSHFDTSSLKVGSTVFILKYRPLQISACNTYLQFLHRSYSETLSFGYSIEGYSGSPLYNSHGAIVGMHWGSVRPVDVPTLLEILEQRGISKSKTDFVRKGLGIYKEYSIGFSIDIKSLIGKYLKGYL